LKQSGSGKKHGQSLIEACLCILLISLIFAGLFQVSQIFAAREILYHAANRSTRAKAVGLNRFMTTKAARVAAIPNAGRMVVPEFENVDIGLRTAVQTLRPGRLWDFALGVVPVSVQANIERARIPQYLASVDGWQAAHILDYDAWDSVHVASSDLLPGDDTDINPVLHATVSQDYPLWAPLHRAFYADDSIRLAGDSYIENHYPLYLDAQAATW